jgi:DNA-binding winged helix-turn-helix (wHTH) protein
METKAYLIVESGKPYKSGKKIPLKTGITSIGRKWDEQKPDIAFEDGYISRNHAQIVYREGDFELYDLKDSKNGVKLNGKLLDKGAPYKLKHNDEIVLAKGNAVLRFFAHSDPGKTQDIEDLTPEGANDMEQPSSEESLIVEIDRREVVIDGQELRPRITGYEFELLLLLYQNRGKAVSHQEIVEWVWRDTSHRETILPQNVTTLVYRLRNCLGDYGKLVVNLPGYGYRLDYWIKHDSN